MIRYYSQIFLMDLNQVTNREEFFFSKFLLKSVSDGRIYKFLQDLLSIIFDLILKFFYSNEFNFFDSLIDWIHIVRVHF